ncbi:hypothetical protein A9264_01410 [Vibrio sp. UCD-FRSSP16_10]|uniref:hypothetical protein n=1 Tax=unclassified Vibrio TaxID=2614977 RepID=UPI0007FFF5B4|nr:MULTISPECIES: hypothetical protein [unclassified Vibrio]OBT17446.1 hypothetical protein A9260_02860 [Vibrio sp. UCD-FRSSP16_30]OBT23215.1 hypothetical protein A9264_01410 [Vibrio sp. UCD-FRSSP16_10]
MSVVNSALSKLADKEQSQGQNITKAEVPKIKRSKPIVWLIGGFTISMALGGWAVSQQGKETGYSTSSDVISTVKTSDQSQAVNPSSDTETIVAAQPSASTDLPVSSSIADSPVQSSTQPSAQSPTHSKVQQVGVIHSAQPVVAVKSVQSKESVTQKASTPKAQTVKAVAPVKSNVSPTKTAAVKTPAPVKPAAVQTKAAPTKAVQKKPAPTKTVKVDKPVKVTPAASTTTQQPMLIAQVNTPAKESMTVEHIEFTPRQLADKSIARAEKAMDSNDGKTAFAEYTRALQLVPNDENVRQQLSALYYGRKDPRKAAMLLQDGIRINEKTQALRFALAKLLIKEQQPEAALSSLMYIPDDASKEYLALRAGLAQEVKNTPVALESYQTLSEREPDNARWWLGLGIQQERSLDYPAAQVSYTKALGLVGVSTKTQAFIRDRLRLLKSLEGDDNGN